MAKATMDPPAEQGAVTDPYDPYWQTPLPTGVSASELEELCAASLDLLRSSASAACLSPSAAHSQAAEASSVTAPRICQLPI